MEILTRRIVPVHRVVVEGHVRSHVRGSEKLRAIDIDRSTIVVFESHVDARQDRGVVDLESPPEISSGVFVLVVTTEAHFGVLVSIPVSELCRPRRPPRIVEAYTAPRPPLVSAVIKVTPYAPGRQDGHWRPTRRPPYGDQYGAEPVAHTNRIRREQYAGDVSAQGRRGLPDIAGICPIGVAEIDAHQKRDPRLVAVASRDAHRALRGISSKRP